MLALIGSVEMQLFAPSRVIKRSRNACVIDYCFVLESIANTLHRPAERVARYKAYERAAPGICRGSNDVVGRAACRLHVERKRTSVGLSTARTQRQLKHARVWQNSKLALRAPFSVIFRMNVSPPPNYRFVWDSCNGFYGSLKLREK